MSMENIEKFPKITFILRGYTYEETEKIIEILSRTSFKALEIALKDEESKKVLEKIISKYSSQMIIGAGTVLTKDDLLDVIKIGVKFVLSPISDEEIIDICKENNVICVPGAYSPTEIYNSYRRGADIVKVFPAENLGPNYFKAIKAPLTEVKLMAVGGINENNAPDFLNNGADYVGIGSGVINKKEIEANQFENMQKRILKLQKSLINFNQ